MPDAVRTLAAGEATGEDGDEEEAATEVLLPGWLQQLGCEDVTKVLERLGSEQVSQPHDGNAMEDGEDTNQSSRSKPPSHFSCLHPGPACCPLTQCFVVLPSFPTLPEQKAQPTKLITMENDKNLTCIKLYQKTFATHRGKISDPKMQIKALLRTFDTLSAC